MMAINFRLLMDAVHSGLRAVRKTGQQGRKGHLAKSGRTAKADGAAKAVKVVRAVTGGGDNGRPRGYATAVPAMNARPRPSEPQPGYPGDFDGRFSIEYSPKPDGEPNPGEVVWGWVPFEEDHSRGKDRPVLLVGRSAGYLLGLMLTSRDRVSGADGSADYVDVGSGSWDRQGRPSEARLDRVLQLSPGSIRREGAVLNRARFEKVAEGLRRRHGWS